MKTNYLMKLGQSPEAIVKSLGVALIGTALAAAYGGHIYWQCHQDLLATERSARAAEKLAEIDELDGILRLIDEGRTNELRQFLGGRLSDEMQMVEPLLVSVDAGTVSWARNICNQIAIHQMPLVGCPPVISRPFDGGEKKQNN